MVTVDPDASYCVSVQAQYENQNTIDVYWLFDDGGVFIVVNRIMPMHIGDILAKGGAKERVSVACLGSYWAVETLCNVVRKAPCLSPPLNS